MLSNEFGRHIKERRLALGLAQEALCQRARVSRAVLSRLESQRGLAVQTDVLDKLLEALGGPIAIGVQSAGASRVEERLKHRLRQEELRQRHLRVALSLYQDPHSAPAKIDRALKQVSLWEERKSCSPRYIERWRQVLAGEPAEVAAAMACLGEWENAMFQNTPWAFEWK